MDTVEVVTRILRVEARETLRLALPITLAHVALMAMGLVDAALVGRVSGADLAGVSIGNAVVFASVCPAMGVSLAVGPVGSQAVGAGDPARAWHAARSSMLVLLVLSLPTMAVAWAVSHTLRPAGVTPIVALHARDYVIARLPSIPAFLVFTAMKTYLEALGLTRPLVVIASLANVVNLGLAALFIFGDRALVWLAIPPVGLPSLGCSGAGIATSMASVLLAVLTLATAWKVRPDGAVRGGGDFGRTWRTARELLRLGLPIGGQVFTEVCAMTFVTVMIGRLGSTAAAAQQVGLGLRSFTFMIVLGLGNATAVRVGRAVGAGVPSGPRRSGLVGIVLGIAYVVACAGVLLTAARSLSALFSDDVEVVEASASLLRIAAIFQIADGVQAVATGALRGTSDTRFPWLATLACQWGLGVPLGLWLEIRWGLGGHGLWWGLTIALFLVAAVLVQRFVTLTSARSRRRETGVRAYLVLERPAVDGIRADR